MKLIKYIGIFSIVFALAILSIPIAFLIPFLAMGFAPLAGIGATVTYIFYRERPLANIEAVAVVEDDEDVGMLVVGMLKNLGVHARWFRGDETIETIFNEPVSCMILDWRLGMGQLGSDLLKKADDYFVRAINQTPVPVITFSSLAEKEIDFPQISGFAQIDHWNKSMGCSALRGKLSLLASH